MVVDVGGGGGGCLLLVVVGLFDGCCWLFSCLLLVCCFDAGCRLVLFLVLCCWFVGLNKTCCLRLCLMCFLVSTATKHIFVVLVVSRQ